ncbi:unnamed protein product [Parajaminaea phylloscopi]
MVPPSLSIDGADSLSGPPSQSAALPEHCYYCFEVLNATLSRQSDAAEVPFADAGEEFPLFVTWNVYSSSSPSRTSSARLRGCIGVFKPVPLAEGLADYTYESAFKDGRFSPITARELPRLECGVSLLTDFEECTDYLDWELGVHGIYIYVPDTGAAPRAAMISAAHGLGIANEGTPSPQSSTSSSGSSTPAKAAAAVAASAASRAHRKDDGRRYLTATYLPDVAPAQGWTKVEAVDSAIRKAGWNGRITEELRAALRVRRYQSSKCTRRYDEWVEWRQATGRAS